MKFARTAIKAVDQHKPKNFAKAIVDQQGDIYLAMAYLNRLEAFVKEAKLSLEE